MPSGLYLYKSGYGFGKKGTFLLSAIKKYIAGDKPADLVISDKSGKSIKGRATITVTLPYDEVHNLLVRLGRLNEDNEPMARLLSLVSAVSLPAETQDGPAGTAELANSGI